MRGVVAAVGLAAVFGAVVVLALGSAAPGSLASDAAAGPPATPSARLPPAPGPFAPSFLAPVPGEDLDAGSLSDVATCEACHAAVVEQWRSSAHAWASFNNPWYRTAVDRFRDAAGREPSRFCGGCHDPALLPGGGMDGDVTADDARAYAGVGCLVCHGARGGGPDGNASLALSTAPVPLPIALEGRVPSTSRPDPDDFEAESLRRHRQHVGSAALRDDGLCIACHRGFLGPPTGNPHFLVGMDDGTAWRRSVYAGAHVERIDDVLPAQGCLECHMGASGHRFPGAQTALAAALGDDAQREATEVLLRSAASVDVAALRHQDGSWSVPSERAVLEPGERVSLDVVIRNLGAGHHVPAGTRDLQDTWLEVDVRDADGRLVAEAGRRHEATGADPTAHVLRAYPIDDGGRPELHHVVSNMRAVAWDHTIAPRDAAVVRYRFTVPAHIRGPLEVTARLRHRRHHLEFQRAACEATESERGRSFALGSELLGLRPPDGCLPAPVLELAEATVRLDGVLLDESGGGDASAWRRSYDHALGLMHQVAERLDEARPSLDAAWQAASTTGTDREQAMVLVLQAELEGRQGRTQQALDLLDRAETLLPGHPAIAYRRGEALALVWRWREAAEAYRTVTERAPENDLAWQRLAQALVSLGDDEAALAAAAEGLRLQPRDPSLLLAQALALEGLGAPASSVEPARAAYLAHRSPDEASAVRYACFRDVPGCADERLPVPVRELRPVEP